MSQNTFYHGKKLVLVVLDYNKKCKDSKGCRSDRVVIKCACCKPKRGIQNFHGHLNEYKLVICPVHLPGQNIFCPGRNQICLSQNNFVNDKILFVHDKNFVHSLKINFALRKLVWGHGQNFCPRQKIFCHEQKLICLGQIWFCPRQKIFCPGRWTGHKGKI